MNDAGSDPRLRKYILVNSRKDWETGCWIWEGQCAKSGWPRVPGRQKHGMRFIYRELCGELDQGQRVVQSCGNKRCVSPEHMIALTYQQNRRLLKGWKGTETECQIDIRADGSAYVYALTPGWEYRVRRVRGAEARGNGEFWLPPGTVRMVGLTSRETEERWHRETRARTGRAHTDNALWAAKDRGWTGWKEEKKLQEDAAEPETRKNELDVG